MIPSWDLITKIGNILGIDKNNLKEYSYRFNDLFDPYTCNPTMKIIDNRPNRYFIDEIIEFLTYNLVEYLYTIKYDEKDPNKIEHIVNEIKSSE